jgi:hypothetical protein
MNFDVGVDADFWLSAPADLSATGLWGSVVGVVVVIIIDVLVIAVVNPRVIVSSSGIFRVAIIPSMVR